MEILAKGKKFGKQLTVKITEASMLFNDKYDKVLKYELERLLELKPVFAGTYAPEEAHDPINIINILSNYFFDDVPTVTSKGIAPMECEAGRIY